MRTGAVTRILLVEGDALQADTIGASLRQKAGWEVTRAGTLLEAIRAAGEGSFDAAVLDADLPDGSGLDILDFLRIGSPGIRIMLLSDKSNESIAFHALSHGAGDFLVKDNHLETELPRRMETLLERVDAEAALVQTLLPVTAYETRDVHAADEPPSKQIGSVLDEALEHIVTGNVIAAGLFDIRGRPVATKLQKDTDPEGLGFALGTLHGQVGALWTYGNIKPTGYRMLIEVEGGTMGLTAIPGTFIVALLFESGTPPRRGLEKLDQAGLRLLAALQGGSAGDAS